MINKTRISIPTQMSSDKNNIENIKNASSSITIEISPNNTWESSNTASSPRKPRGFLDKMRKMWKKIRGQGKGSEWGLSREEASEMYQEYYKCITRRQRETLLMESGKRKPVHAVMALLGEKVVLRCRVCSRPDQDKLSQLALWQHVRREDSTLGPLILGDRLKVDPQGSLVIRGTVLEDAGQYNCLNRHRDAVAIYQLDIRLRERRVMVNNETKLRKITFLPKHNLQLLTSWSQWGKCDTCGKNGQKKRHGTCLVKKIDYLDPIMPRDFPMMQFYPDGVPCHSTALPVYLRRLKKVRGRPEETLVQKCHKPCPTTPPPVIVTDKDGNLLEVLPPVEKFYNLGEKPKIGPMVKRRVMFEPENKHLIMKCSDVGREAGVRWMRGKRRIDPTSIKRQTQGRVWVDSANRLNIAALLISDTAVYNCWESQRHVASIKVIVIDEFKTKMKDYITYGAFGFTILASLTAACLILCRKKNDLKQPVKV